MTRRTTFAVIAILILIGSATVVAAKERDDKREGRHAKFEHKGDKWILHNDHIAVWFHIGKEKAKPDMRVVINGTDDERSGYRVKILRLCEVGPNETACTGGLPRVNLAKANDWNVVTQQGDESLTLTMVLSDAQAIVKLIWHINTTSAAVKFDLNVDNWRWENTSNRLVLDTHVIGKNLHNATGDSVNIEDSGYIRWAPVATATHGVNDTRVVNVEAVTRGAGDGEGDEEGDENESKHEKDERKNGRGGHLYLVFNGTGGYKSLDYDPEFGIAGSSVSSTSPVPAAGLLAGLAVLSVAAFVLGRKRS